MKRARWASLAALALLAALAASPRAAAEPARLLPPAREDGLLYVALGDSTVSGAGATRPEHNFVSRLAVPRRLGSRGARLG